MSSNGPFSNSPHEDRTVVRPNPGGRTRPNQPPVQQNSQTSLGSSQTISSATGAYGLNPLVGAANALLLAAGQLRDTTSHPNPEMLRNLIARELTTFENSAQKSGATPEIIFTARYLLCTFMDEIVLTTPWGSQSNWSQQTLLSKFHNEVSGGDKFFQILDKLMQAPACNLVLLELVYICLALGFKGKYRIQAGGVNQVEEIQHQVMSALLQQRGDSDPELSPHWHGVEDKRNQLARFVPLWVVSAVTGTLLLLLWFGFSMSLSTHSEPVMEELQLLGRNVPSMVERAAIVPKKTSNFSVTQALSAEISKKLVDVTETNESITIRLRGIGLFKPAQANLTNERIPLVKKIAQILERFSGHILVAGHTDNDPVGGSLRLKFPSNWDLSQKRAETVASLLSSNMSHSGRIIAEGFADTQPLVANNSPTNKAHNRRVEITLMLVNNGGGN